MNWILDCQFVKFCCLGMMFVLIVTPVIFKVWHSQAECAFQTEHAPSIGMMDCTLHTPWLMRSDTCMNFLAYKQLTLTTMVHEWHIGWESCMMKMLDGATEGQGVN